MFGAEKIFQISVIGHFETGSYQNRFLIPLSVVFHTTGLKTPKREKSYFFLNGCNLMGSYVDQSLTRNESVISRAQTSWIPTIIPVIIGILLLPFYGLGLLIIVPVLLRVWSTELALTNQRVIAKVGLIRRNTVELRIDKVESLGIHQGILGRIFNYGSIVIKGTGGTNTPIPNIKAPMQFRSIVNNHIEEMNSKQQ